MLSHIVLKMLHRKSKNRRCTKTVIKEEEEAEQREYIGAKCVNIKKETEFVDLSEVLTAEGAQEAHLTCRVCLGAGNIPIFGDDDVHNDFSSSFITFSGVEISNDDMYPKYLCAACRSLLQGAVLFRETAQESDKVLKRPKSYEKKVEPQDFGPDDTATMSDSDDDCSNEPEQNPSIHCEKCNLDFSTLQDLHNHKYTAEHKNKKYECGVCNKTYTGQYYKKHIASHKDIAKYVCDICGKSFKLQGQFSRHRKTHDDDLPFQCQVCPYRGRFSESLKMHMRKHTGEKPYQCPECPLRCINKSNLIRHIKTHKKEYDFKCDLCNKGFFTKRDLTSHYRVIHSGIKDHLCGTCGKAFGSRKLMMKHQLKVHKRPKLQSGRTPLYLLIEKTQHSEEPT